MQRSEGGGAFLATDTLNGQLLCHCGDVHSCSVSNILKNEIIVSNFVYTQYLIILSKNAIWINILSCEIFEYLTDASSWMLQSGSTTPGACSSRSWPGKIDTKRIDTVLSLFGNL